MDRTQKWLEELASKRNTIQTQEDIIEPGKTAGQNPTKLYGQIGWFFIDISGFRNSFGLALFVERDMGLRLVATGRLENPYEKVTARSRSGA